MVKLEVKFSSMILAIEMISESGTEVLSSQVYRIECAAKFIAVRASSSIFLRSHSK